MFSPNELEHHKRSKIALELVLDPSKNIDRNDVKFNDENAFVSLGLNGTLHVDGLEHESERAIDLSKSKINQINEGTFIIKSTGLDTEDVLSVKVNRKILVLGDKGKVDKDYVQQHENALFVKSGGVAFPSGLTYVFLADLAELVSNGEINLANSWAVNATMQAF